MGSLKTVHKYGPTRISETIMPASNNFFLGKNICNESIKAMIKTGMNKEGLSDKYKLLVQIDQKT